MTSILLFFVQRWQLRSKIPLSMYLIAGLTLALGGTCWRSHRVGASSYAAGFEAGREDAVNAAQYENKLVELQRGAHTAAIAKTDTVLRRVVVMRHQVDTVILQVPDTLRRVPEIARLIRVTQTLTAQVDTLSAALIAERAIGQLRAQADSAALVMERMNRQAEARRADNAERERDRKPGWKGVLVGSGIGALLVVARGLLK